MVFGDEIDDLDSYFLEKPDVFWFSEVINLLFLHSIKFIVSVKAYDSAAKEVEDVSYSIRKKFTVNKVFTIFTLLLRLYDVLYIKGKGKGKLKDQASGKGSGKGLSKGMSPRKAVEKKDVQPSFQKLRTLDIFAGCGGK